MSSRVKDEVAIITGSGNGIGKETAILFAEEGAKVVVTDVDVAGGEDTVKKIVETGGHAIFVKCDISHEAETIHLVEETVKAYGRIDILVNNAAIFVLKSIQNASKEDLERSLGVNVIGPAILTKHVVEVMKKNDPKRPNGRGSIVNFGSISGIIGQEELAAYAITKAALMQLTRNLSVDLGPLEIRANSICPGVIVTEATYRHMKALGKTEEEFFAELTKQNVIPRLGTVRDAALPTVFIASKEARYITGAQLVVDGGFSVK